MMSQYAKTLINDYGIQLSYFKVGNAMPDKLGLALGLPTPARPLIDYMRVACSLKRRVGSHQVDKCFSG